MTIRIAAVATATAATLAITAPIALAGSYEVRACDAAGGVNNSWVASTNNSQMAAYSQCPSGGNSARGMVARNGVQSAGSSVPPGTIAWLRFDAAPGTAITRINASYRFFRASPATGWEVGLSNGAKLLTGCPPGGAGCSSKGANDNIAVPGSQTIYIEAFCSYAPCPTSSSGDPVYGYLQAGANLYSATVTLQDDSAPGVGSLGGSLLTPGWKRSGQTVTFNASDNSGISQARVLIDGQSLAAQDKRCDYTVTVPCPQGAQGFDVDTSIVKGDGMHTLAAEAADAAGNRTQQTQHVWIDNTPPGPPQQVRLDGGDGWRSSNDFTLRWQNPSEPGTAPVQGALWKICPASGKGTCASGSTGAVAATSAGGLKAPDAGDYIARLWLRDEAGNADERTAADPVHLRLDDEPPQAEFATAESSDPTLLVVDVTDKVSGLGGGTMEVKPATSDAWTPIETRTSTKQLRANLDDESLRDGVYDVRARVVDRAGNERTTATRADGKPMQVTLPLRVAMRMSAGAVRHKRRRGRTRTVLRRNVKVGLGRRTRIRGRLKSRDGTPLADTEVQVLQQISQAGAGWSPVATLKTSRRGGFSYLAPKGVSRTIRFRYPGTATIRPANRDVVLRVAASSTLRLSDRRYINGETAHFRGRLRGGHVPAQGKLVELQVFIRGRYRTFATTRTDTIGRWRFEYRFDGTAGRQRYRFRTRIPREATYPYETGTSRRVTVIVRGL